MWNGAANEYQEKIVNTYLSSLESLPDTVSKFKIKQYKADPHGFLVESATYDYLRNNGINNCIPATNEGPDFVFTIESFVVAAETKSIMPKNVSRKTNFSENTDAGAFSFSVLESKEFLNRLKKASKNFGDTEYDAKILVFGSAHNGFHIVGGDLAVETSLFNWWENYPEVPPIILLSLHDTEYQALGISPGPNYSGTFEIGWFPDTPFARKSDKHGSIEYVSDRPSVIRNPYNPEKILVDMFNATGNGT